MKRRRPWPVTIITFGVLTLVLMFWTRFVQTILWWETLQDLPLSVPPVYLLLSGFVFGVSGMPLIWGLWVGKSWALWGARLFLLVILVYYWFDRLFLTVSEVAMENWPFALSLSILMLVWFFWYSRRPRPRAFFKS